MASGEKVNWRIPSGEWQKFLDYVHDKCGDTSGYTTREVASAMEEWIDQDDYAGVEEKIDRLVRAAGRTPDGLSKIKSSRDSLSGDGDTTKVQTRVHPDLKAEFRAVAKESDDRVGIQLAKALRAHREGGRARRLEEKVDRIVDDAEELLSDFAGEESMTLSEKRKIKICQRFTDRNEVLRSEIEEAISEISGPSVIDRYMQPVLDNLGLVPHPYKPEELFIPKEERAEMQMADKPAVERKDYDDLTRDEKVRGIQIELARDASSRRTGKAEMIAQTIKDDVFNSRSSEGHTYDIMREAAHEDGFYTREKRGVERICADISKVDSDLLEEAGVNEPGQSAGKAAATDGGINL